MSHYRKIVVQTYENTSEPSKRRIRAHPLAGQGLSTSLNVECSTKMRDRHPVGTLFIVDVKITDYRGTTFLYTYYNWPYEVVTPQQANRFIKQHNK
jgi:hypothetical protein